MGLRSSYIICAVINIEIKTYLSEGGGGGTSIIIFLFQMYIFYHGLNNLSQPPSLPMPSKLLIIHSEAKSYGFTVTSVT